MKISAIHDEYRLRVTKNHHRWGLSRLILRFSSRTHPGLVGA